MGKLDPFEALGVFKPVGHIVIAFPTADEMEAGAQSLLEQGFDASAVIACSPEQMKAQVDARVQRSPRQAALDHELRLIEAHRVLAEQGCSFLIVHAGDADRGQRRTGPHRKMKSSIGAALWPARERRALPAKAG